MNDAPKRPKKRYPLNLGPEVSTTLDGYDCREVDAYIDHLKGICDTARKEMSVVIFSLKAMGIPLSKITETLRSGLTINNDPEV